MRLVPGSGSEHGKPLPFIFRYPEPRLECSVNWAAIQWRRISPQRLPGLGKCTLGSTPTTESEIRDPDTRTPRHNASCRVAEVGSPMQPEMQRWIDATPRGSCGVVAECCLAARSGHESPHCAHDGSWHQARRSKRGTRDANFAKLLRPGSGDFSGKPAVALAAHSSGLTSQGYMLQVVAMLAPKLLPRLLGLSSSTATYAAPRRVLGITYFVRRRENSPIDQTRPPYGAGHRGSAPRDGPRALKLNHGPIDTPGIPVPATSGQPRQQRQRP